MAPQEDLINILSCLDEATHLSEDESLLSILSTLNDSAHKKEIFLENYGSDSFTIADAKDVTMELGKINSALNYLRRERLPLDKLDDFIIINQIITGSQTPNHRVTNYSNNGRFPKVSSISKGLEISFNFLRDESIHLFVRRVGFIQAVLGIHPFEDGNHRTLRLVLDYWLIEMDLPPTTLTLRNNLLIANTVSQKKFKLEDAIQKVLYGIGETIR